MMRKLLDWIFGRKSKPTPATPVCSCKPTRAEQPKVVVGTVGRVGRPTGSKAKNK